MHRSIVVELLQQAKQRREGITLIIEGNPITFTEVSHIVEEFETSPIEVCGLTSHDYYFGCKIRAFIMPQSVGAVIRKDDWKESQ
ncbi:MAG: hypothetical protein IT439_06100 [Phycisphaerales bacterium]|nr:hypothetical protein [Phycisphaerales bacterium]